MPRGCNQAASRKRLHVFGGQVLATHLGTYGPAFTSSGDAYAISGLGTFASVSYAGPPLADWLVTVNPVNGAVTSTISPIAEYNTIFGLAGWLGRAYAFSSVGDILKIDLDPNNLANHVPLNQT